VKATKVIDLFAGPGGLGEGFSAFRTSAGEQAFKIALSIEKEASAYRTLKLRAFFRQFSDGKAPDAYYAFLRGELGCTPEELLYKLPELQNEYRVASEEAQLMELGVTSHASVYRKVRAALDGEEFILIGGPPCQAYSLVGRARNSGEKSKDYNPDEDPRNFLYQEYLRVIAKFQPLVFVMENVKGILSAKTSKGPVFPRIQMDLKNPNTRIGVNPDRGRSRHSYQIFSFVTGAQGEIFGGKGTDLLEPRDYIIKSENFGIPQARHRVILLGVRDDLASEVTPQLLGPAERTATVLDSIGGLPALRSTITKWQDGAGNWASIPRKTAELLQAYDSKLPHGLTKIVLKESNDLNEALTSGSDFGLKAQYQNMPTSLSRWFRDPRQDDYITNHSARGHMYADLARYWFASIYRDFTGKSPKAHDFPKPLWPAHANFASGKFADRFRVQGWDKPSTTVTSHISKDGHYFIHPDARQMRSLTVREAARLQTFPDNYHFVGNRTSQYVQVGNAVPPLLAVQLACVVNQALSLHKDPNQ
jgi:DNA (cytosine-5)-methyltransferase 1